MAKLSIFLLVLLSFLYKLPTSNSSSTTDFISAECRATLYPALCVKCLSSYSATIQPSRKQLAQAALSVSLSRAQSMASFLSKMARMRPGLKPIESPAVKDCMENMASAVDQLSLSVKGLSRDHVVSDSYALSSVETWVGAALTFENTCLEGFGSRVMDGNVKVSVRRRVVDCTSH